MCLVAGLAKKRVTEMDLVAFQKKGGLTVTVQCTAVRTQSNLVIGTSWYLVEYLVEYLVVHLVVLGGILGGTWWCSNFQCGQS